MLKKIFNRAKLIFALTTIVSYGALAAETANSKINQKSKHAIVNIDISSSLKAYGAFSTASLGTGFLVDKAKGIIVTNKHIANPITVSTFKLTFHNGQTAFAKLLYSDPWLDFSFLQVDPSTLPSDIQELSFCKNEPKLGENVIIVGNNEGKSFSTQNGKVSDLYVITGSMPQHSITISLNTKGGSSGSPVLNLSGEVVALNYGGSDTYALGLHPAYIKAALESIKKDKTPSRKHIGAIVELYSLSDAAEYRNFPQDKTKEYIKKFPNSMSNALVVAYTLQGSPAQSSLFAGDIIWAIDGKMVGPSLSTFDMAMNQTSKDFVTLSIYRNGESISLNVNLYNLEDHIITRMVQFAGVMFFEADDVFCNKTGLPAGKLTLCNSLPNSTFNKIKCYKNNGGTNYLCEILYLNDEEIDSLDKLIKTIPKLKAKKHFTIDYSLLCSIQEEKSELFGYRSSSRDVYQADITYDESSTTPRLFTFDKKEMQWKAVDLV